MATATTLILNYNGKKYLEKFLPGILQNNNDYPVIIGDNASTDNYKSFLIEHYPQVELVEFATNYGYCEGYNRLIAQVDSDYLIIMNSDISPAAHWLDALIHYLDTHPQVAAVQPKILSEAKPDYFEYAGAAGGYIDQLGYPFCRGRIFNQVEKDSGQYNNEQKIFWASGACFVVRRAAFLAAGGFDSDFFAHMEEIDLCWRLQKLGHSLVVVPGSTVYHVGGGTLDYNNPFKTYLNHRNGLNLLIKNLPKSALWPTLLARVLFDWLSIGYYLIQGKFRQGIFVCRAHWHVVANMSRTLKKRRSFNNEHPREQPVQLTKLVLIWHYFVRKRKTFAELIPD